MKLLVRHCVHRSMGSLQYGSMAGITSKSLKNAPTSSTQQHEHGSTAAEDIPFSRAKIGPFFQQVPQLGNQFTGDVTLVKYLKRHMPPKVFTEIYPDLERFGERVATDIYALHTECDRILPRLEHYDPWGRRVDHIVTCAAWKQMKRIAAEEGLIAIAYERKYDQHSRLYQMAKQYLYQPSSGLYSCPLAMTDGAAKSIESLGLSAGALEHAYKHLTSRDPDKFWTSGQWMTERKGGSDVAAGCETVAVKQSDDSYRLYGYKWFSSATDSDMALTLARPSKDGGRTTEVGTRGLAMFYLPVRNEDGSLNNIEVQRLKDKLGTRQVPTAELLLDGAKAIQISEDGRGVVSIANMLTLTRIHNAISSAGAMRRIIHLARDYSTKRTVFGRLIKDQPLHVKTLANMEVEARAALLLTLEMSRLLGLDDTNKMTSIERDIFRLMTPVAKLYTAKQAVSVVSEGLECFGGMGYLEDTGLPHILRDAQVLPIWEGTTNILSLDVLRAVAKSSGSVLKSFLIDINNRLKSAAHNPALHDSAERVNSAAAAAVSFAASHTTQMEIAARQFAFSLARTYMGMLLLEHANWQEATPDDVSTAIRWCQQELCPVTRELENGNFESEQIRAETEIVFQGFHLPNSKL